MAQCLTKCTALPGRVFVFHHLHLVSNNGLYARLQYRLPSSVTNGHILTYTPIHSYTLRYTHTQHMTYLHMEKDIYKIQISNISLNIK